MAKAEQDSVSYCLGLSHARGFCGNASDADAHEKISLQNVERSRERTPDPICFFAKSRKRQRLSGLSFRFTFRFNFRCPCSGCGTECGLLGSFAHSRPSLFLMLARRVELIAPERTQAARSGIAGCWSRHVQTGRLCKIPCDEQAVRHLQIACGPRAGIKRVKRLTQEISNLLTRQERAGINVAATAGVGSSPNVGLPARLSILRRGERWAGSPERRP